MQECLWGRVPLYTYILHTSNYVVQLSGACSRTTNWTANMHQQHYAELGCRSTCCVGQEWSVLVHVLCLC